MSLDVDAIVRDMNDTSVTVVLDEMTAWRIRWILGDNGCCDDCKSTLTAYHTAFVQGLTARGRKRNDARKALREAIYNQ